MATNITKQITTVLLRAAIRDIAYPMGRARENGVMANYDFVARLWDRVGDAGDALAGKLEHVAVVLGIDLLDVLDPMWGPGEA